MTKVKDFLKINGKIEGKLFKINFIFVFVFLNAWDFVVNRSFFNGMILGIMIFGIPTLLWFLGKFRFVVLLTLISIFQFLVMLIFVLEGFGLGGAAITLKSLYWVPYLVMAGVNGFVGLNIYSEYKESKSKTKLAV